MRTTPALLVTLLGAAIPALVAAQERPALEVGTSLGVSVIKVTDADGTTTVFGVPGGSSAPLGFANGSIYMAFFPADNFFIEPELALTVISDDSDTFNALALAGWLNYVPAGVSDNSVYLGGAPNFRRSSDGDNSESQWGVSARVGYRTVVRDALAVRFEAGFQRWLENKDDFNPSVNVFTFRVGLGGILKHAT